MTDVTPSLYNQPGKVVLETLLRQKLGLTIYEAFDMVVESMDGTTVTLKAVFPDMQADYHRYVGQVSYTLDKLDLNTAFNTFFSPVLLPYVGDFPPDVTTFFTYLEETLGLLIEDGECYFAGDPNKTPLVRGQTLPASLSGVLQNGLFALTPFPTSLRWKVGTYLIFEHVEPASEASQTRLTLSGTLPQALVNDTYHFTYTVTGGVPPYQFSIASGDCPGNLDPDTGELTIDPVDKSLIGAHRWRVVVKDATEKETWLDSVLEVGVDDFVLAATTVDVNAYPGEHVSVDLGITGGIEPYTLTLLSGTLPKDGKITDGQFSGTFDGSLTSSGLTKYAYFIEVKDSYGTTGYIALTVKVQDHNDSELVASLRSKLVSWFDVPYQEGFTDGQTWVDRNGKASLVVHGSLPQSTESIDNRELLDYSQGYAQTNGIDFTDSFTLMSWLGAQQSGSASVLFNKGLSDTSGWALSQDTNGVLSLSASLDGAQKTHVFDNQGGVEKTWWLLERHQGVLTFIKDGPSETQEDLSDEGWDGTLGIESADPLVIAPEGESKFKGAMGDLVFFDQPLWSDELKWLYNQGAHRHFWDLLPQPAIQTTLEVTSAKSEVQQPYTQKVTVSGGVPPYTVRPSSATPLPSGIYWDEATLSFRGVPTQSSNSTALLNVTDRQGRIKTLTVSFDFEPSSVAVSGALGQGEVSVHYYGQLDLTGPYSPFSELTVQELGTLPAGLSVSLENNSLIVTGIPEEAGVFHKLVSFKDSQGSSYSTSLTLTIREAFAIVEGQQAIGVAQSPFSYTIQTKGGFAPFTFVMQGGTLPDGLAMSDEGVLTGTATTEGFTNLIVKGSDANNVVSTETVYVRMNKPLDITFHYDVAKAGHTFLGTVNVSNGTAPYVITRIDGSLPRGLVVDNEAMTVSGTPVESGTFSFTIHVIDYADIQGYLTVELVVAVRDLELLGTFPTVDGEAIVDFTYTARYGVPPYTFAITGGELPEGLGMTQAGRVHGTIGYDEASWTVTVTDSEGSTATLNDHWVGAYDSWIPGHPDETGGVVITSSLAGKERVVLGPGSFDFTAIPPTSDSSLLKPGTVSALYQTPVMHDGVSLSSGSLNNFTEGGGNTDGLTLTPGQVSLEQGFDVPVEGITLSPGSSVLENTMLSPRDDSIVRPGSMLYGFMLDAKLGESSSVGKLALLGYAEDYGQATFSQTRKSPAATVSPDGLTISSTSYHSSDVGNVLSSTSFSSGKYYLEFVVTPTNGTTSDWVAVAIGLVTQDVSLTTRFQFTPNGWSSTNSGSAGAYRQLTHNGVKSNEVSSSVGMPINQVCRMAVDLDAGKLWLTYIADPVDPVSGDPTIDTWVGGGDPSLGTDPSYTFDPLAGPYCFAALVGDAQMTVRLSTPAAWVRQAPLGFGIWPSNGEEQNLLTYALPIVNPGADDGTTGWTVLQGSLGTRHNPPIFDSGTSKESRSYQQFDIPVQYLDYVKGGFGSVNVQWNAGNYSDRDSGEMEVVYLDASGNIISTEASGLIQINPGTAVEPSPATRQTFQPRIPINATAVRIQMHGVRGDGTDNNAYFDDIAGTLIFNTAIDPFAIYVHTLLHCDGTDGSATFTNAGYAGPPEVTGAVTLKSDNAAFNQAAYFPVGSNPGNYLTIPSVNLGTKDFTLECMVYLTQNTVRNVLFETYAFGETAMPNFLVATNDNGGSTYLYMASVGDDTAIECAPIPLNTIAWVQLIRRGNDFTLAVNGVEGDQTFTSGVDFGVQDIYLGVDTYNRRSTGLYLDEIRLTVGKSRAVSNQPIRALLDPSTSDRYDGLALSFDPTAYWPMTETYGKTAKDLSGNGIDLDYGDGIQLAEPSGTSMGPVAKRLTAGTFATSASTPSPLLIYDDITIFGLQHEVTNADSYLVSFAASGDSESVNFLWSLRSSSLKEGSRAFSFWEYGSGQDVGITPPVTPPDLPDRLRFVAMRKNAGTKTVDFFIGSRKYSTPYTDPEPTGGTSSRVCIGSNLTITPNTIGAYRGIGVVHGLLTDEQILSLAAATRLELPPPQGKSWWRVYITEIYDNGGDDNACINELEMRGEAGGPTLTVNGTAFASSTWGDTETGWSAPKWAFDGQVDTNDWAASGRPPSYLGYHFATPVEIVELAMWSRENHDPRNPPKRFIVQSSSDSTNGHDGTWQDEWSVTATPDWGVHEKRIFTNPKVYQDNVVVSFKGDSLQDATGRVWEAHGNVASVTSQTLFGHGVLQFDGVGDYLSTAADIALQPTTDFTVELFVLAPRMVTNKDIMYLIGNRSLTNHSAGYQHPVWWIAISPNGDNYDVAFTVVDGKLARIGDIVGSAVVPVGAFAYIGMRHTGNTFELWCNGTKVGEHTDVLYGIDAGNPLLIGTGNKGPAGNRDFEGYLGEIKITRGIAKDLSVFPTPPDVITPPPSN